MTVFLGLAAVMTLIVSAGFVVVGLTQTFDGNSVGGVDPRKILVAGLFGLVVGFPALAGLASSVGG